MSRGKLIPHYRCLH